MASAFDTVPKGSVDLWPVLRVPAADLAKAIAAGKHDACLSELLELERAHGKRDLVIEACVARKPAKPAKAE